MLAPYAEVHGEGNLPIPDDITITRPLPRSTMAGTTSRMVVKTPRTLTSMSCHHWSGSASQVGPTAVRAPALATTRSGVRQMACSAATAWAIAVPSVTSATRGRT